jgi:hypothetical protein
MRFLQVGFEHCEWSELSGFPGSVGLTGLLSFDSGSFSPGLLAVLPALGHLCAVFDLWLRQ